MHSCYIKRRNILYVLFITIFLLAGCSGSEDSPTPTETITVISEENEPVSASGEVIPRQWNTLGFSISGKIAAILVVDGERVSAGQELARLEEDALMLAQSQANAALRRAEAILADLQAQPRSDALAAARAALASAKANYNRLDQADAEEIELEAAQAQINSAQAALDELEKGASEAQIRSAAADVKTALLSAEQARLALEDAVLRAPYDGTVVEVYAQEADLAAPGTPTLLLADLDDLQVATTDLSELDVARIQLGDSAVVSFDALPAVTMTGKVVEIANQASPGTNVTFRVVITLDQIPADLRWGMTAFVTINK
jgi:HlyD family secretion protein